MLKNPEDRRARRSRKLLKQSLLNLMQQKEFSQISVRDITEAADMNRGTFYLHYSGPAELLKSLEEELLEELGTLIDAHMEETVEDGSVRPILEPVLDFAVDNRETCAALFASSEAAGFLQAIQQLIQDKGGSLVERWFHLRDKTRTDYLLSFLAWGSIGLLKEWFNQGMDLPREDLIASAQRMADGAATALVGTDPAGKSEKPRVKT